MGRGKRVFPRLGEKVRKGEDGERETASRLGKGRDKRQREQSGFECKLSSEKER